MGVGNRFPRRLNGADRYYPIPNAKTMQNPEKPGAKLLIYMAIFPSFFCALIAGLLVIQIAGLTTRITHARSSCSGYAGV